MRADWNQRAREDARYYVAFGRRGQNEEEFFASAADVVRSLEEELKRLSHYVQAVDRRGLEIGCGLGRLMRPMSRNFGELHGVDVSDEMIRLAQERFGASRSIHLRVTNGSDLASLASDYFDFVYSYAVFQHIPSREVVLAYFDEIRRVLKTGGLAKSGRAREMTAAPQSDSPIPQARSVAVLSVTAAETTVSVVRQAGKLAPMSRVRIHRVHGIRAGAVPAM